MSDVKKFIGDKMQIFLCEYFQDLPSYYPGCCIYIPWMNNMGNFKNNDNQELQNFPIWQVLLDLNDWDSDYIAYISLPICSQRKVWDVPVKIQIEIWCKDTKVNFFAPELNEDSFHGCYTIIDFFSENKVIGISWKDFFQQEIKKWRNKIQAQIEEEKRWIQSFQAQARQRRSEIQKLQQLLEK